MRLSLMLALVLCLSLNADGRGLLAETALSNDNAEFLNQLEENYDLKMDSLNLSLSLVAEQFTEDEFVESSGVSPCSDEPCQNEGNCTVLTEETYVCKCLGGYYGKNCEKANLCYKNPCKNGAECKSRAGRVYFCKCAEGFQGKHCDEDIDECLSSDLCLHGATCVNTAGSYRCKCTSGYTGKNCGKDIDECTLKNGGCSHDCTNTVGSYTCSCPDAELSLANDKHSCEAIGVIVKCLQNKMSITIPKPILKGMDREHLRLLDPKCGATETPTHFSLETPLTGCNTTRRHTKSAIVYSNKVLEIPLKKNDIITRVREIEIPFSCYYSNSRVATAIGLKAENRKLVFSEKGKGNFTVMLELFHSKSFATSYGPRDFPLSLKLRQYMYFQAKVQSKDKRLSIMPEKCFATPAPQQSDPVKHVILDNGCAIDDTVEFYPSITGTFRFGLEAFEFVDQPFLFMHCHVVICNASDAQSRCARGCEKKRRRRRKVGHHSVFSLTQGPITLDYNNEYQEQDDNLAVDNHMHTAPGMNVPLVAAMGAMTALTMFGVIFMALRNKSRNVGYQLLNE